MDNKKHSYDLSSVNLIVRQGEDKGIFFEHEIEQVSQARESFRSNFKMRFRTLPFKIAK